MTKPPDESKSRILIVEDHPMFREQIAHLIGREPDMLICGEADNIRDGLELACKLQPHLIIVDISLRGASGLELLKQLRGQALDIPALVLSMHDESLYAERAFRAGARGYITKHEASAKVMTAVRQVLQGEIFVQPKFVSVLVKKIASGDNVAADSVSALTDRELDVFEFIGRGLTTREISARLNIGATTIETYRARIKEKLQLENAAQLQTHAARWVEKRDAVVPV